MRFALHWTSARRGNWTSGKQGSRYSRGLSMRVPERVGELDGIRGLAILLVMVFHFGSLKPGHSTWLNHLGHEALGFGWCGVDLFFVLSGFLITGILLDSKGSRN